jgi:hypothetical protein
MMTKRILSALLAAVMLAGSLASCAAGGDEIETTSDPNSTDTAEQALISDALPEDLFYNDDEITIISRYKEGWTSGEIAVKELMGDPVNDAVFERNKAVESRLGIKINSIEDSTDTHNAVVSKVATAVKGGLKDYDIMAAPAYTTLSESLNGTFLNLRGADCEYLDLEREWWIQGFNEAVEYRDAQFAILGSMVLSMYRFGFVTVFNKEVFEKASQPFLYDYVKNGTWTLDKQASLIPLFHEDDGNGKQDKVGDRYGFVSSTYTNIDAYWSAAKLDIIRKDEDGNMKVVQDLDRLQGTAEKVIHIFHNCGQATYDFDSTDDDAIWSGIRKIFADGYAAMASFRFMEMENSEMRNMEQEYGVVPMPKYDENQSEHYTLLHDQFTVLTIPSTVVGDRAREVSAVLEAMSSASYNIVKPVYYEETLRTKIAADPTAADMMDIITQNVYIDAGILYISVLGSYHHAFRNIVSSGINSATATYKGKNKACEKSLQSLSKKLDRLVDRNS